MKTKDIIAIVAVGIILAVAGVILINRFGSARGGRTAEVEVAHPIDTTFNEEAKVMLRDGASTDSFTVRVNLDNGLGNTRPFGE